MDWYNVLGSIMFLTEESAEELKKHTSVEKTESIFTARAETITLANIRAVFSDAARLGKDVTLDDFYRYM